jgi:hypothetical protein
VQRSSLSAFKRELTDLSAGKVRFLEEVTDNR